MKSTKSVKSVMAAIERGEECIVDLNMGDGWYRPDRATEADTTRFGRGIIRALEAKKEKGLIKIAEVIVPGLVRIVKA